MSTGEDYRKYLEEKFEGQTKLTNAHFHNLLIQESTIWKMI